MRSKIEEYIIELNQEIDRCSLWIEENMNKDACNVSEMEGRVKALTEVMNDLQNTKRESTLSLDCGDESVILPG